MAIMDTPEPPPAIHHRIEGEAEKPFSVRPIGEPEVTVVDGMVDDFVNRPAELVLSRQEEDQ